MENNNLRKIIMKKNILAIAIAATAVVTSVQATASAVDFYGEIGFGVESISGVDDLGLTSQGGKFGLTGQAESTEDYTFDYQVELALDTVGAADDITVSKANITVGSEMGNLTIGRQADAVRETASDLIDVFAHQGTMATVNDAITFETKGMGQLKVVASGVMDATSTDMFDTMGVGGSYQLGEGLTVSAYQETDKDAVLDDVTSMAFGGGYIAGDLYISGVWGTVDDGTTKVSETVYAAQYSADAVTFSGSLWSTDASDAQITRVGGAYDFGTNIVAYADYSMANVDAEAAGMNDTFVTGVRLKF